MKKTTTNNLSVRERNKTGSGTLGILAQVLIFCWANLAKCNLQLTDHKL